MKNFILAVDEGCKSDPAMSQMEAHGKNKLGA